MLFTQGDTIRLVKEGELVTIQTAARELRVSHMTIRRWIKNDHLHPIRPGREYLIELEELDRFRDPKARPKPGRPRTRPAPEPPAG